MSCIHKKILEITKTCDMAMEALDDLHDAFDAIKKQALALTDEVEGSDDPQIPQMQVLSALMKRDMHGNVRPVDPNSPEFQEIMNMLKNSGMMPPMA
jgi:hypothetical protein